MVCSTTQALFYIETPRWLYKLDNIIITITVMQAFLFSVSERLRKFMLNLF